MFTSKLKYALLYLKYWKKSMMGYKASKNLALAASAFLRKLFGKGGFAATVAADNKYFLHVFYPYI